MSSEETIQCSLSQLVDLSVETWRLRQWVSNVDSQNAMGRHICRKYERFFQEIGIEVLDMSGKPFEPGLAVEIVDSVQDEALEDEAVLVEEMIVPVVFYKNTVVKHGQVVVRKASSPLPDVAAEE